MVMLPQCFGHRHRKPNTWGHLCPWFGLGFGLGLGLSKKLVVGRNTLLFCGSGRSGNTPRLFTQFRSENRFIGTIFLKLFHKGTYLGTKIVSYKVRARRAAGPDFGAKIVSYKVQSENLFHRKHLAILHQDPTLPLYNSFHMGERVYLSA